jgi:hypothetical protein
VNITFKSEVVDNMTDSVLVNASVLNQTFTFNLHAIDSAESGLNRLNFSITLNSSEIASAVIPLYIKIPFFIDKVNYSRYIYGTGYHDLSLTLTNQNPSLSQNVTLNFTSDYFEFNGSGIIDITNLAPLAETDEIIQFRLKNGVDLKTTYWFSMDTIWENKSQGISYYAVEYRASVEVASISGPVAPVQNYPFLFEALLMNYNLEVENVVIRISWVQDNGKVTVLGSYSESLQPGENKFIYNVNPGVITPWNTGEREFRVEVIHDNEVIAVKSIRSNIQVSLENAILGYVLIFAVIGAIILFALYKKRQIESLRR